MRNKTRQSGFSLLEVMMAVVVMTMGMVFVASMFPVGLYNARKTADATMNAIELNNSVVSAGLVVDAAMTTATGRGNCFEFRPVPYSIDRSKVDPDPTRNLAYDINSGPYDPKVNEEGNPNSIHFLIKPNVLADYYGTDTPVVVVDDIEYANFKAGMDPYNQFTFQAYSGFGTGPYTGASHFLVSIRNILEDYNQTYNYILPVINLASGPVFTGDYVIGSVLTDELTTPLISRTTGPVAFIGDIGYVASPPVNYMDQDVLDRIAVLGGSTDVANLLTFANEKYINQAVYDITMARNYSWAAFYDGNYPYDGAGNQKKPDSMYIFILKNHNRNVRYAVQEPASMAYYTPVDPIYGGDTSINPTYDSTGPLPVARDRTYDRHFPVPWLVHMDIPVISASSQTTFPVPQAIADILRPGSIILDADPAGAGSRNATKVYNHNGRKIFEVKDVQPIYPSAPASYNVTLTTSLGESFQSNSLFTFWVFPPAVNRATGEFEDDQPVVDVVYRKMKW